MLVLGIRTKLLLLMMAATLLPLLILNFFWTNSQRQVLLNESKSSQALVTNADADKVTNFINDKVRTLIIHSQSPSLQQFNLSKASLEIGTLLYQDNDIERASLVNQSGQEVVALTSNLKPASLQNVASSDAFKVVNYFAGSQYISPVTTGSSGHPIITIAIPLVTFTTPQDLSTLSTAEPGVVRNPQDIKGALIAQVSLENLWQSVLSTPTTLRTPSDDYAYVVNDKGQVIAHPDASFTNTRKDLSNVPVVALFKSNLGGTQTTPQSVESTSEKGVDVMATYQKIPTTEWAVVFEEPMSSIYDAVNQASYLGVVLSLVAIVVMGALSVWLSRYVTSPIIAVAKTAKEIGQGKFATRVTMRRRDEMGVLANSINMMGSNLENYVARMDAQRRQLEVILNSTTDGIMAIDAEGKVVIANRAAAHLAKKTVEAVVGQRIQDIFMWTKKAQPFFVNYKTTNATEYTELEYTDSGDAMHYVDLIVVQAARQTIVTIHDETKSRELDVMKGDFVSVAAHELRTPLARIRGYVDLISGSAKDEASQRYIKEARDSSIELAAIINNLLGVSHIERSQLAMTTEKVDWAKIVSDAVNGIQPQATRKNITLVYEGEKQGNYVSGDKVALREVADNLIDNAIKYTGDEGHINVRLSRKETAYVLSVKDDGRGIPSRALPYLFTKFYRVHNGPESGNTGSGLGLYIAKSIIERHSGTITVEAHEGKGSEFTVVLPVLIEKSSAISQDTKGDYGTGHHGWTTKNITR